MNLWDLFQATFKLDREAELSTILTCDFASSCFSADTLDRSCSRRECMSVS